MRARSALSAMLLVLLFSGCRRQPPPPRPDLVWDGPKLYTPASTPVAVSGFGLTSPVDVLPPAPPAYPVVIARDFVNIGNQAIPAGYTLTELVQSMNLVSTGSSIGFVTAATISSQTMVGPALAPGDTASAVFAFAVPQCGMYQETLTLDAASAATESNESNNIAIHHFFVPGAMSVTVTVGPSFSEHMWHATLGPAPNFTTVYPAFPATTHTFTITPAPGTTYYFSYRTAPLNGALGSKGVLVGPAPVLPPGAPVSGVTTITFQVTPTTHNVPATDILTDLATENFVPKVTAITSDGCMVDQQTAKVRVSHP